jgi:hypothetical protein
MTIRVHAALCSASGWLRKGAGIAAFAAGLVLTSPAATAWAAPAVAPAPAPAPGPAPGPAPAPVAKAAPKASASIKTPGPQAAASI